MHDRDTQPSDGGLFADKGGATPTRDFVPRLKTDEPAKLETQAVLAGARPEAAPLPDADGVMGGLIRRRTDPRQELPTPEETAAAATRHADQEAVEITKNLSQHIDNGMLYESLKLGLPLPKLSKALTDRDTPDDEEPKTFGEAARERVARPTTREPSGTAPSAHANKAGSKGERAYKPLRTHKRHQLTTRLSIEDFNRLKAYSDESGRTYQDIMSTATTNYLDIVAGPMPTVASEETRTNGAAPKAPAEPSADTRAPNRAPIPVKSPYDWFGSD